MTTTMTRPRGVGPKTAHDPGDPLVTSHCFAGETRYWTRDGIKTLAETAETVQEVLVNAGKGAAGTWREAMIHSYGEQPLWAVTLRRNQQTKVVRATAEHRWLVRDHGTNKPTKSRVVVTSDLKAGHRLAWQLPKSRIDRSTPSPFGIAHGVTFGDGSKTVWGAYVNLWGEKDAQLLCHFPETIRREPAKTPRGVEGVRVMDLPLCFKDKPSLAESVPYLYGWLAGYFAADGCVSNKGQAILNSASRENLEFVQLVAALLGIGTYDIGDQDRLGYGTEPSKMYRVQFIGSTLRPDFFLIKEHRERYEAIIERGNAERIGWTVVSAEPTGDVEEVFCARVPEHENFVLDGWINVMNCPFCGSGQVVGRSDGTIGCDFCGAAYIVRVQPAFPGMPQMPNGPGAPSDVGPDGMVDPGMIGPDGVPVDGGPPPDGDSGGGPPAAPDDDGSPGGDDGKEDDSGSGPPPKGKGGKSKKESLRNISVRRYRGVRGQPLTEEQLVRHIAVVASGGDPAVMARLRATAGRPAPASRKVAGFSPEELTPHCTLSSGHQVSIGRHGEDWYGVISAPHPFARHTHMMYLGREDDPRAAADRELSRGPARNFVHSTTDYSGAVPGNPVEAPGAAPGAWWRKPSQVRAPDPIFHSASAG